MELLSGRPASEAVDRATREVLGLLDAPPRLAVVLSSDDPASAAYSRSKVKKGAEMGIEVELIVSSYRGGDWTAKALERAKDADAVVLERPLPPGTDPVLASTCLPPLKDVEGMHPENLGLMLMGHPRYVPPTALGVLALMHHYGIEARGRHIAVIGRGTNVGRSLSVLLSQRAAWGDATVTLLHSRSAGSMAEVLSMSDIVISAVGKAGSLKAGMVKDDAVLIDVGQSQDQGTGRMIGDVELSGLGPTDVRVTPTPGGTGPVTVSCMFANVVRSKALSSGLSYRTGHQLLDSIYR